MMQNRYVIGIIILIFFLLSNIVTSKSQSFHSKLFFKTKNNDLTVEEFAEKYSLLTENIKEYYPLDIDVQVLLDINDPVISISENMLSLRKTRIIQRSHESYSYFGTINNEISNRIIITVKNGFVAGTLYFNSKEYNIVTFNDMNQYLIRIDNNYTCGNNNEDIENIDTLVDKITIPGLKSTSVNSCNMRIIIIYTPAAEDLFSNILTSILHVIDVANEYLDNSLVDETWELAYAGLTDYTEVYISPPGDGRFTDLTRFHTNSDGYMDEVHNLRDIYSADVCVLLSECQYSTQCGGVAVTIDATSSQAFCLVHAETWGAVPNRIFSHEIGHLLGCRHPNDGTSSPYAYGHGYYNGQENFQTILGTVWNIDLAPNFSNPDVYFEGNVTGTSNWNDCSRVLEIEIPEKVAYYQPEDDVTITSSEVSNILYGEVISEETVTIQNATIPDGSVLHVRSDETTISSNFTVELGAEFEIKNESVHDCN